MKRAVEDSKVEESKKDNWLRMAKGLYLNKSETKRYLQVMEDEDRENKRVRQIVKDEEEKSKKGDSTVA